MSASALCIGLYADEPYFNLYGQYIQTFLQDYSIIATLEIKLIRLVAGDRTNYDEHQHILTFNQSRFTTTDQIETMFFKMCVSYDYFRGYMILLTRGEFLNLYNLFLNISIAKYLSYGDRIRHTKLLAYYYCSEKRLPLSTYTNILKDSGRTDEIHNQISYANPPNFTTYCDWTIGKNNDIAKLAYLNTVELYNSLIVSCSTLREFELCRHIIERIGLIKLKIVFISLDESKLDLSIKRTLLNQLHNYTDLFEPKDVTRFGLELLKYPIIPCQKYHLTPATTAISIPTSPTASSVSRPYLAELQIIVENSAEDIDKHHPLPSGAHVKVILPEATMDCRIFLLTDPAIHHLLSPEAQQQTNSLNMTVTQHNYLYQHTMCVLTNYVPNITELPANLRFLKYKSDCIKTQYISEGLISLNGIFTVNSIV